MGNSDLNQPRLAASLRAQVLASESLAEIGQVLRGWLETVDPLDSVRFQAVGHRGELLLPGEYDVVDALVHYFELWPDDSLGGFRGGRGVVAFMYSDERCDICHEDQARFDAAVRPSDMWAFMCGDCFRQNSDGVLGMGRGQYLIYTRQDQGSLVDLYRHIHDVKFGRGT